MANYRRELSKNESKYLHEIFNDHVNDDGGIFIKDKRKKLLGLKLEHGKYFEDTADFWYDVSSTVKSALKDLELFFEVAHPEKIKDIIYDSVIKEESQILKKTHDGNKYEILRRQIPSLTQTLNSLFKSYYRPKKTKLPSGHLHKYSEQIEEGEWKAILAHDIIKQGINYLKEQKLISSMAHQRLTEEFEDMINVEISRGVSIPLNKRTIGFFNYIRSQSTII